jgi:hypothetical protein
VFRASIWACFALTILWAEFLYPHFYWDPTLLAYSPSIWLLKRLIQQSAVSPIVLLLYCKQRTGLKIHVVREIRTFSESAVGIGGAFVLISVLTTGSTYVVLGRFMVLFEDPPTVFVLVRYVAFCFWIGTSESRSRRVHDEASGTE